MQRNQRDQQQRNDRCHGPFGQVFLPHAGLAVGKPVAEFAVAGQVGRITDHGSVSRAKHEDESGGIPAHGVKRRAAEYPGQIDRHGGQKQPPGHRLVAEADFLAHQALVADQQPEQEKRHAQQHEVVIGNMHAQPAGGFGDVAELD